MVLIGTIIGCLPWQERAERMSAEKLVFTATVTPATGGEWIFRNSIDHMMKNGVGSAHFIPLEVAEDRALLRGEIITDPRLVTERGLKEYLTDILAAKQGIFLDLEVRLREGLRPWVRAARAA